MGTWSSTAPTLPAGSEWSAYTAATSYTANHYKHTLSIRVARLAGRQVAIDCQYVQANGSYGDWSAPGTATFTPRVGTANENATTLSASKSTRHRYYVTDADPGVTLRVTVTISGVSAATIYRTITAPAILPTGMSVFIYDGGWQQASEVDVFDGSWKNALSVSVYDNYWEVAN